MASERQRERHPEERRMLDRLILVLAALAALLGLADSLIGRHPYFDVEHLWAFYGVFGAAACLVMVLLARLLVMIVTRPEDYYDR